MSTRFLQINTPLGEENTYLLSVSGREQLGRLFEYNLTLVAKKPGVTAAELLGKNITFGMELPGGQEPRYFNGYITRFSDAGVTSSAYFQEGGRGRAYVYHLTVHPWPWFLTRRADSRIFQDMTVPDIIKAVCDAYPFALLDRPLNGSYGKKEYCCQYRESDFNFISRLMEQEGIYYYFKQENGKHTMVLCDSASAHHPFPGYGSIPYSETGSDHTAEHEHIAAWHVSHEVQSGRFTLNDFDFENPKANLVAKANHPEGHELSNFEFYDYPGQYTRRGDGETYARIRLEEFGSQYEVVAASGPVRGVKPGHTFNLTEHPSASGEFLVTTASYGITNNPPASGMGAPAEFSCSFQAISSRTAFRPERLAPKPIIQGPQTAIVVGPSGEEIFVDKYGRVKVQFHWDRYNSADDKSSCWVRVSQPWASNDWGAQFLPRIGHEVVVEFLEGDPDRPLITGRVYNGAAMPPWALPAEKTRSGFKSRSSKGGGGFNEFSFDDKKGSEEIFIHAEKDKNIRIKNRRTEYVGEESHRIVTKDYRERIKADHHLTIKGDENVKLEEGGFSLKVAQDWQGQMGGKMLAEASGEIHLKTGATLFVKAASNISAQAEEKVLVKSKKDSSYKAGMNMATEAGMNMYHKAGMSLVLEAGMQITLKAAGAFITLGPAGVAISGPLVLINSGGAAGSGSSGDDPDDGSPCMPVAPKPPNEAHDARTGSDMAPQKPGKPDSYSPQAQALKLAWEAGAPFCEACAAAAAAAAAK